jgi:hypothetical protein
VRFTPASQPPCKPRSNTTPAKPKKTEFCPISEAFFLLKRDRDLKGKGDIISLSLAKKIFSSVERGDSDLVLRGAPWRGKQRFPLWKIS